MNSGFIPVVAVALVAPDGRVLLQQRPANGSHGSLWEFPGGKIEPGESAESALLREIEEELGLGLDAEALIPVTFATDPTLPPAPRQPHAILLYRCERWSGVPEARAADALGWFAPEAMADLDMPPLDVPLARALNFVI